MGLVVDNFAGGGGASTGIEMALGRPVDIAINHNPAALTMHAANHPSTRHYVEDVWQVDPRAVTRGQPVDLAWFSPDCTHFSKAKGAAPRSSKTRGLAWVAVKWAAQVRPAVICLENVEEFRDWGPLGDDGQPIKERRGEIFDLFLEALREQGYNVEHRELTACDYGAPTTRKRFFLVARSDGQAVAWPQKTHGIGLTPYRTAAECIDWSIPCPSIFNRPKPLAENTLRRIAKGVVKYVLSNPSPFIVSLNHTASYYQYFRGQDVSAPLGTMTQRNGYALVTPYLMSYYGDKQNSGDFRGSGVNDCLHTQTTANRHALVSVFLNKHYSGVVGSDMHDPINTITSVDHHSLAACFLERQFGASIGQGADTPMHTVMPGGSGKTGIVAAFLDKHATCTTRDRFGLVTVTIAGETYAIVDIGMRMLQPRELYNAQGFPASYIINPPYQGKPLTKTAQVQMAGNSVCPPVAAALVQANMPALCMAKAG